MQSFSYLEPVCCSVPSSNCCFLTCIQVSQEADQVVWYSPLLKYFPQVIVIHTVKSFGIVTSWQIDGETVETVADFIFWGSKITADGDYSHEAKRCLLLGMKVMTNLDRILKSRNITLLIKVCLVKAMVFPELDYKES